MLLSTKELSGFIICSNIRTLMIPHWFPMGRCKFRHSLIQRKISLHRMKKRPLALSVIFICLHFNVCKTFSKLCSGLKAVWMHALRLSVTENICQVVSIVEFLVCIAVRKTTLFHWQLNGNWHKCNFITLWFTGNVLAWRSEKVTHSLLC